MNVFKIVEHPILTKHEHQAAKAGLVKQNQFHRVRERLAGSASGSCNRCIARIQKLATGWSRTCNVALNVIMRPGWFSRSHPTDVYHEYKKLAAGWPRTCNTKPHGAITVGWFSQSHAACFLFCVVFIFPWTLRPWYNRSYPYEQHASRDKQLSEAGTACAHFWLASLRSYRPRCVLYNMP